MQFSIFDLARTAARLIPGDWRVKRGDWDVSAVLFNASRSFCLCVDEAGDLCLDYKRPADECLPEVMPHGVVAYPSGLFLEAARPDEGLYVLSGRVARAVEAAVTNTPCTLPDCDDHPATPDVERSDHDRAEQERRTYRVCVLRTEFIEFAIDADSRDDAEARYLADGVEVASETSSTRVHGVTLDQQ